MRLTVIGCSGSLPGPDSAASCYLVEADGFRLLLDLGSGALGTLQRVLPVRDIDAVLLSHLHPDHCLDLCGLYVALRYGPGPALERRIPVYGPSGLGARLAAAYGSPEGGDLAQVYDFHEVGAGPWELGPFEVVSARVDHPVEAYAHRLQHRGRAVVYSGDCAPCGGLDLVAREADLALVEAAFVDSPDNPAGHHHTGRESGELAARVGVGRLVVTHVPPWFDPEQAVSAARAVFDGWVEAAVPLTSYEV